jgi:RNA polymerase sigma-B factor
MPEEKKDKELLRRYHEGGDTQAREQLIEQYLPLVRSLARRYSYRGEQLEDLVQVGCIGLIKAIDRFDTDRGVELTTYATPNIIGEIKRHFRDKGWAIRVPRGLQELNVRLSHLLEELTVQLERSPTIPELAKSAGVEEEDVLEALESGQAYATLSLSAPERGRRRLRPRPARVPGNHRARVRGERGPRGSGALASPSSTSASGGSSTCVSSRV